VLVCVVGFPVSNRALLTGLDSHPRWSMQEWNQPRNYFPQHLRDPCCILYVKTQPLYFSFSPAVPLFHPTHVIALIRCSTWIRSLTDWFLIPTNWSLIPDWLIPDWWSGAAHGSDPWLIGSWSLLIYPWSLTDWSLTDDQVQRMDQIPDWLIPVPY